MDIATYLHRRDKLINTLFRIEPDGKGYYIEDGRKYTRHEFERRYPTPFSFVAHNGKQIDGRVSYLQTD